MSFTLIESVWWEREREEGVGEGEEGVGGRERGGVGGKGRGGSRRERDSKGG